MKFIFMKRRYVNRQAVVAKVMLLVMLTGGLRAASQTIPQRGIWLNFGAFMENISLPGISGLRYGVNPGIQVGVEYHRQSPGNFALFHRLDYTFSTNPSLGTNNMLTTQFGPTYRLGNSVVGLSVGGGYNLFRPFSPIYRVEGDRYRPRSLQGHWVATAALSYGYQFGQVIPYAGYGFYIDSPFINSSSPILPHQLFQVGLKISTSR